MDLVAGFTAKELEDKLAGARKLLEKVSDPREREAYALITGGYERLLQCFSRKNREPVR